MVDASRGRGNDSGVVRYRTFQHLREDRLVVATCGESSWYAVVSGAERRRAVRYLVSLPMLLSLAVMAGVLFGGVLTRGAALALPVMGLAGAGCVAFGSLALAVSSTRRWKPGSSFDRSWHAESVHLWGVNVSWRRHAMDRVPTGYPVVEPDEAALLSRWVELDQSCGWLRERLAEARGLRLNAWSVGAVDTFEFDDVSTSAADLTRKIEEVREQKRDLERELRGLQSARSAEGAERKRLDAQDEVVEQMREWAFTEGRRG